MGTQERVSQTEKEKSQLLMQQALITQFMQNGTPGERSSQCPLGLTCTPSLLSVLAKCTVAATGYTCACIMLKKLR